MASFHLHCSWLLFFFVFPCSLVAHECNQSLGFLKTMELLFWAIILSLFIIIVSIPAQRCHFTVTVGGCYIFSFFSWMSATTRWGFWLHWKYFAEQSYYRYISSSFSSEHNGTVSPSPLFIVIYWSFPVIPPHGWVQPLVEIADYIGITLLSDHIIAIQSAPYKLYILYTEAETRESSERAFEAYG